MSSRSTRSWRRSRPRTRPWSITRSSPSRKPCSARSTSRRVLRQLPQDYGGTASTSGSRAKQTRPHTCATRATISSPSSISKSRERKRTTATSNPFPPKRRLKIGTFKVEMNGFKLGERFLKIIFDNALRQKVEEIYVTIFPTQCGPATARQAPPGLRLHRARHEDRAVRHGACPGAEHAPAFDVERASAHVPLRQPQHASAHRADLAELPHEPPAGLILRNESPANFVEQFPHRNAIRKVYISRSINRDLKRGDAIVFYRTGGYYQSVVTTVGIVENVHLQIRDAPHFISLCRKRSVFTDKELMECWNYNKRNRPFIVEFLYAYSFTKRPNMKELIDHGIIRDVNPRPEASSPSRKTSSARSSDSPKPTRALLSIKPDYAEAIFSGRKRFEFRRSIFRHDIRVVIVYITSPVGQVVGEFSVEDIITDDVDALWDRTETQAGIYRNGFFRLLRRPGRRSCDRDRERPAVQAATGPAGSIWRSAAAVVPVPLKDSHGIDRGVHRPVPQRVRLLRPSRAARRTSTRLKPPSRRASAPWSPHERSPLHASKQKCGSAREQDVRDLEEISADIVDLAGARVALYFPGERDQVDRLVRQLFPPWSRPRNSLRARKPTYKKRFSGYWATHYRVQLKESSLGTAQQRYADARVEIQVASVLMHAWSEVEHDLVYKPFEGTLSDEEYAILDELNGLVIAGEIALERLQKAGEARVAASEREFVNHYDLASHLLSRTALIAHGPLADSALGRVDLLFELLKRLAFSPRSNSSPTSRRSTTTRNDDRSLSRLSTGSSRRTSHGTRCTRRSGPHDHSRFAPRKPSNHQLRNSTEPSVTCFPNGPGWSAS